jgi:CSLREA domain-containing protein
MTTQASNSIALKLLHCALLLAALCGFPAWAANLRVNTLSDDLRAADGLCTLREAVNNANENIDTTLGDCIAGAEADTITFRISGTITLGSPLPDIVSGSKITLNGDGQSVIVSGGNVVQVMRVNEGARLHLKNLTVADGFTSFGKQGAGILNEGTLTVSHSTFSGNNAIIGYGGGIFNSGNLTVSYSIFSGNSAYFGGSITNEGDGILTVSDSTFSGNESFFGSINNLGTLTVSRSTFSGNSADYGGGINNETDGIVTASNSTFSDNDATFSGGGIRNLGTLTVSHSTFSDNNAVYGLRPSYGFGGGILNFGTLNIANTLLANSSSGGDCENSGTLNATGVNLVEDGSCGASSDSAHFITGDPNLSPLANNGGPTQVHALLEDSIAIDRADNTVCAASPVNNLDQRGQSRPVDGNDDSVPVCDIGAYEFVSAYHFVGFFPPIASPPTLNSVRAGRAVPIKFSLGGNYGLNILAPLYSESQPVACDSGTALGEPESMKTPRKSPLSYNPTKGVYTYVWKTSRAWSGTCRKLIVRLNDASEHVALFRFK